MKTKLFLLMLLLLSFPTLRAQKVLFGTDCTTAGLGNIMTKAGIKVIVSEPDYIQIVLDSTLKIKPFIDLDTENQWLVINLANVLKDGVSAADAKELASAINEQTNLIRASYEGKENSIDFRYYFVIKGGFTEAALLSALEFFKSTYVYAIVTVDNKELFN